MSVSQLCRYVGSRTTLVLTKPLSLPVLIWALLSHWSLSKIGRVRWVSFLRVLGPAKLILCLGSSVSSRLGRGHSSLSFPLLWLTDGLGIYLC